MNFKVKLNSLDRWGSTPLNYAPANSAAAQYIKAMGGFAGTPLPTGFALRSIKELTATDYKLLFAASRNDWATIDALW